MRVDMKNPGFLLTLVQDSGCGINDLDLKDLSSFKKEKTSIVRTKGLGIGLSTAKDLTNALQGGIHLNSEVGQGTEVGFSILTQMNEFRINSKDLKTQARLLKEDHKIVYMGKINYNQFKVASDLTHKRMSSSLSSSKSRFPYRGALIISSAGSNQALP